VIFSCECECVFRRQVDIWFKPAERTDEEQLSADQQPQQHDAMIDRVSCLRPVLFDVFADHTTDPPMLNYQRMVIIHSRLLTTRLSYIWLQCVCRAESTAQLHVGLFHKFCHPWTVFLFPFGQPSRILHLNWTQLTPSWHLFVLFSFLHIFLFSVKCASY